MNTIKIHYDFFIVSEINKKKIENIIEKIIEERIDKRNNQFNFNGGELFYILAHCYLGITIYIFEYIYL